MRTHLISPKSALDRSMFISWCCGILAPPFASAIGTFHETQQETKNRGVKVTRKVALFSLGKED